MHVVLICNILSECDGTEACLNDWPLSLAWYCWLGHDETCV